MAIADGMSRLGLPHYQQIELAQYKNKKYLIIKNLLKISTKRILLNQRFQQKYEKNDAINFKIIQLNRFSSGFLNRISICIQTDIQVRPLQQYLIYSVDFILCINAVFVHVILSDYNQMEKGDINKQKGGKSQLALRLVTSQEFTPQMAINYLYQWRNNRQLLEPLLTRIQQFFKAGSHTLLPTAIFILSLQPNPVIESFCQRLSKESLSCYLLLRWAQSTYMPNCEAARNRLDNSIFSKNGYNHSGDIDALAREMKLKQLKLNYTIALNDYFQRLFAVPHKIKKYSKSQCNQKLREKLIKIHNKFYTQNPSKPGILLPLQENSCMAVSVSYSHCITFSTKERVPFKIVFQTISEKDLEQKPQIGRSQKPQNEKESLILPHSYFGTEWKVQIQKIVEISPYRHYPSYHIQSFIVKSGDDLRQEHMAMELIRIVKSICQKENIKIWLRTYSVIPFDKDSGFIQFVEDTKTVSYLKERSRANSLKQVYKQLFGDNWQSSISNFVQSLAGYSVVQYLFQIKDRHNNNILVDTHGHIIHIDFSFILSSSPGNISFEKAPFKLTKDYIQLMNGVNSDYFMHFKHLFFFAIKYIRNYKRQIMERVEMMTHCPGMKCFDKYSRQTFQRRFHQGTTDEELMKIIQDIISSAVNSYSTGHYDTFQWFTNYIYH